MKKFVALFPVLLLGLMLSSCSLIGGKEDQADPVVDQEEAGEVAVPAEALEPEHESVAEGFRVKGPDGWVKQPNNLGLLVSYMNPREGDGFKENISLAREDKRDLALVDYTNQTIEQLGTFFAEYSLLDRTTGSVAGQPGSRIRYQIQLEGLSLITEQLILERPSSYLVITYVATPEQFQISYEGLKQLEESLVFSGGVKSPENVAEEATFEGAQIESVELPELLDE